MYGYYQLSTRILIDDITKWKSTYKSFSDTQKYSEDSFTCSQSITTPRFSSMDSTGIQLSLPIPKECKLVDLKEVMKHNTSSDIWAIFDGRVYNVSSYSLRHPEVSFCFLSHIGLDVTSSFKQVMPDIIPSVFFKEELIGFIGL